MSLPLSQEDRNRLVASKEDLQNQNSNINDANESGLIKVAEKFLNDIPIKKQTDAPHGDLYFYEEELKRLNGLSLPQPLQETGFTITDSQANSRLYVNDGRFKIEENSVTVLDVPIVPFRGYSKSSVCGTNFDIWGSDRRGSSTSRPNVSGSFTINSSCKNLKVEIDGNSQEIDFSSLFILPQTMVGSALASSLKVIFNGISGFENVIVAFNEGMKTFTISSGTVGSSSSVEVVDASANDMRNVIGFDVQHMISGKYQNNLMNVEIDGDAQEIKLNDFRKCETDVLLGSNNDELGFYWSGVGKDLGYYGRTRVGPYFCSGINNGHEVAGSIQSKLREVGTGGFKNAICYFSSDNNTFTIYSGTFGISSSVRVLAASDPLRDARSLIGYDSPTEVGNEDFYGYIWPQTNPSNLDLTTKLGDLPNVIVNGTVDVSRFCHSILYLPTNGVNINADWQDFIVATTKIYDDGSRGLPRLYPNGKVIVDATNDRINFCEYINSEKTANLNHGTYNEGEMIKEIIRSLNDTGDANYSGEYDTVLKKFVITSDGLSGRIFSLLFGDGKDALMGIAIFIGFNVENKNGDLIYTSDNVVSFSSSDYFNPVFVPQFYGSPMLVDDTVDEQSALLKEESVLNLESTLLNNLKNMTIYDNEVQVSNWELFASLELAKVEQQYEAVRIQRGMYGVHINEIDQNEIDRTTEIDSLIVNKNSLTNLLSSSRDLINIGSTSRNFVAGVDFTEKGSENLNISVVPGVNDLRIYNNSAPLVLFDSFSKHIPGRFSVPGLYCSSADFIPEPQIAFSLTNTRLGTRGYSYSGPNVSQQYIISAGQATVKSNNAETYNLAFSNTLKMKIDSGVEQTTTVNATSGYIESSTVTSGFVIKAGFNDKLDFTEGYTYAKTICMNNETYNLTDGSILNISVDGGVIQSAVFNSIDFIDITNALASEVVFVLNNSWVGVTASVDGSNVKITHNSIGNHTFQISDGVGSPNVQFGFLTSLMSGQGDFTVTLTPGEYLGSDLSTLIQNEMNLIGSSTYFVDYGTTISNKFTITSNGVGGTGVFKLLFLTGSFSSQSVDYTIGFSHIDKFGLLVYSSDVSLNFTVITGLNDVFTIRINGILSAGDIVISQGNYLTAVLVIEIANKIVADPNFNSSMFTVTYSANKFRITSSRRGTSSVVIVYVGTNDFLRVIKLDSSVPIYGGGDTADITVVTALEVANVISLLSGVVGSDDGGCIRISTITTGPSSSIEITGGTARTIFGFLLGITYGSIKNTKIKVDIDGDTSKPPIELTSSLSPISGASVAADIQTKLQSIGYLNAQCSFNETTVFDTFTDSLRILSGTYGILSSVVVSDLTIIIEAGVNDSLDFEEAGILSAIIPAGFYNGTTLATEIQTQMNVLGSFGYVVTFSNITKKMKIQTSNFFSLLFSSGPNESTTIANVIGFIKYDHTLHISYTSENLVQVDSVFEELKFDAQIQISGRTITDIVATKDDSKFTVNLLLDVGQRKDLEIDITTSPNNEIIGLVNTIENYDFVTEDNFYQCKLSSYLLSRVSEKYKIVDNDTLGITANGGTEQIITFSAVRGSSTSGINAQTRITKDVNDRIRININGLGFHEISLGTLLSADKIAENIQLNVRSLYSSNIEEYAAYLEFTCEYIGTQFILKSGTGGTGSSVVVQNAFTYNAAVLLKLGIMNGGIEAIGTGDFLNSSFATAVEVATAINNPVPVGFSASGLNNYLKITSTVLGDTTRIQITSGSLVDRLGFTSNNDNYPLSDLSSVLCTALKNFNNISIKSPIIYNVLKGYGIQFGNITITFSTVDDSNINTRLSILSPRLSAITARKSQVESRITSVLSALTATLYEQRRGAVQMRLNKKTGTYVKVGDEFKVKENNDSLISANTEAINNINILL